LEEKEMMDIESILRKTLRPALGCTEPVSIALAVSAAFQGTAGWIPGTAEVRIGDMVSEDVDSIRVSVNKNIFKNAFSIYIPNAGGEKGILMASALGAWCDPTAGLELFRGIGDKEVGKARELIEKGKVSIEIVPAEHTNLFIQARVRFRQKSAVHEGTCVIQDEHTNIVQLECDGITVFRKICGPTEDQDSGEVLKELGSLSFGDLVQMADNLPVSLHSLLGQAIELNVKAAERGLDQPLGLGIGYHGVRFAAGPESGHFLASGAAAGSDARMAGYPVEVMSSAGSGNQGMIATVPVVAYCRENGIDEQLMLRAVALSHLVTMYATTHIGYLSTLCGVAMKAGIGAACGITYAMGGGIPEIGLAVKIMAATLSGVICDGAKPGCALKVSSSSEMAVKAASLAMKGVDVSDENGIVADTAENTIRNLARLNLAMKAVDDKVIEIMQEKIN
jgi:L-cysteine desulfidase